MKQSIKHNFFKNIFFVSFVLPAFENILRHITGYDERAHATGKLLKKNFDVVILNSMNDNKQPLVLIPIRSPSSTVILYKKDFL